jgi:hypothetical protein
MDLGCHGLAANVVITALLVCDRRLLDQDALDLVEGDRSSHRSEGWRSVSGVRKDLISDVRFLPR